MKTSCSSRFLSLAVWLLAAFSALTHSWGAISQLGTQSSQYSTASTMAFTVNAGTDRLLVVALGDPNTATNPTAVTYNGTPMLQANATNDGGFSNDAIWYLKLGTGGAITSNIVVTFAAGGNGSSSRFIGASAYSGVDQTTPVDINGPKISGSVTTTGSSLNVTSQTGDLVFDLFDSYLTASQTTVTTGAGQTLINDAGGLITPSGGFGHYTTSTEAGAPSVTMSWTGNAGAVLHLTMNINAGAADTTPPTAIAVNRQPQTSLVVSGASTVFRVTFSESVTGVDVSDFNLVKVGTVNGTVASISGSGSTYDVTVNSITGFGSLRLDLKTTGTGIVDGASNALTDGFYNGQPVRVGTGVPIFWGNNTVSQAGDGTTGGNKAFPNAVDVSGVLSGKNIVSAVSAGNITHVLTADNLLYVWGNNTSGHFGNGTTGGQSNVPISVPMTGVLTGKTLINFAAGDSTVYALDSDGLLYAWGVGSSGQLGDGLNASSNTPVAVSTSGALSGKVVVGVAAGPAFCVACTSDGGIYTWGNAGNGRLGNGTTTPNVTTPAQLGGVFTGKRVVAVSAGGSYAAALTSDGRVYTWGNNTQGQLGDGGTVGTPANNPTPALLGGTGLPGGKTVAQIFCSNLTMYALARDGTLYAWGGGVLGGLGNGSTTSSTSPVLVTTSGVLAGKTIVSLAGGNNFAYVLTTEGKAYSWGTNASAQLGDGTTNQQNTPIAVDTSASSALNGRTISFLTQSNQPAFSLAVANAAAPLVAPTVTTATQSAVTATSATLGGNVTADGGATVTERGIVWGTVTAPTTANNKVANGSGTGTFSGTVTGLPAGTTVFVRAYAINSVNTSYGSEISFTTLSNNADLSALALTTATINEAFAAATTAYTSNVPNATSSVTVTATRAQANATLEARVGANAFASVTSGSPSASLALAVGANTIDVRVTAQDGTTIKTYTITVTRAAAGPPPTAPTVAWPSTVTDTNYGSPRAIGKTTSGDVIMATRVTGGGNTGNLRVTRHAGGTGLVSWTRDINNGNPDDASEMIVDPANGDAYIAARATPTTANSNWFVYKVNGADGTVAWTYTFDGTAAANDTINDIARTSDGNIVVCGDTLSSPSSINYGRVVKLNAGSGAVIWTYLETTNFTTFNAIATDASGNTYATGVNTLNTDGYTVKINSGGTQGWAQPFVGTFGASDSFNNIVVDSNGDCIIGGTTTVATSNTDAIVMKLAASNGAEVWRRLISGTANQNESITNLIVDGSTFYACGFMRVTAGNRSGFVTRVNSDGTNPWLHTKDGSAVNGSDQYKNLRLFNGSIYAVGDATNTNLDVIVSRLNPSTGGQQWSITYDGPTSGADTPTGAKQVMTVLDDDTLAVGIEAFNTTLSLPNGILVKFAPGSATTAPVVTTATQSAVTANSATLGGNVTADGGASVSERGIVWGTATAPTTANNKVQNGSGTGAFSGTVTGLPAGTTVFVRAYAINSVNTSYGSEISFATLPPPTTVTSLNRVNPATSNLATVNWTLTFAAANTGVTASNFSLTGAAAAGATVGTPTTTNAGLTWNVPVTTGSTDGTLTLNLANATGTTPGVSTSLPFAGQPYTMDKTLPTVTSIVRQSPTSQATTNASATFRVTFSEAVNAPATANFAVAAVNASTIVGTIASVTPVNASTYDVAVTITGGSGEFRLKVQD